MLGIKDFIKVDLHGLEEGEARHLTLKEAPTVRVIHLQGWHFSDPRSECFLKLCALDTTLGSLVLMI